MRRTSSGLVGWGGEGCVCSVGRRVVVRGRRRRGRRRAAAAGPREGCRPLQPSRAGASARGGQQGRKHRGPAAGRGGARTPPPPLRPLPPVCAHRVSTGRLRISRDTPSGRGPSRGRPPPPPPSLRGLPRGGDREREWADMVAATWGTGVRGSARSGAIAPCVPRSWAPPRATGGRAVPGGQGPARHNPPLSARAGPPESCALQSRPRCPLARGARRAAEGRPGAGLAAAGRRRRAPPQEMGHHRAQGRFKGRGAHDREVHSMPLSTRW
jgi:hypothetical protein